MRTDLQLACPFGLDDILKSFETARLRYFQSCSATAAETGATAMLVRRRVTIHEPDESHVVEGPHALSHPVSQPASWRGLMHHPTVDRRTPGRPAARSRGVLRVGISSCE